MTRDRPMLMPIFIAVEGSGQDIVPAIRDVYPVPYHEAGRFMCKRRPSGKMPGRLSFFLHVPGINRSFHGRYPVCYT